MSVSLDDPEVVSIRDRFDLHAEVHKAEVSDRLQEAMLLLGHNEREAILLVSEGLSHSEISERLQQPLGTVKAKIRRGQAKMARALQFRLDSSVALAISA